MLIGNALGVAFRKRAAGVAARLAVMSSAVLGTGVTRGDDGAVTIPGTAGWKGVTGPGVARANGQAVLVRWQPGDVQAGSPGRANAPYAAGFFPSAAPSDPLAGGHALTISNNNAAAGQLSTLGQAHGQVVRSVKQVEHDLVAIASTTGGVLYGAALSGARGYGDRPNMRPLAVDRTRTDATLYPGAYSRGAGVRVEEFQTALLSEYPNWYGTAFMADRFTGSGAVGGSAAEVGGTWTGTGFSRTASGAARTGQTSSYQEITLSQPIGLIHAELVLGTNGEYHELIFGRVNANTFHTFFFRTNQIQLGEITNGTVTIISSGAVPSMTNRTVRLEVLIEGRTIAYRVDGLVPSDVAPVTASRDIPNTAGFYLNDNNARLTSFEVQPQSVPIPAALRVAAPAVYAAHAPTITDTFDGTGALGSPYVRTRGDETATRSGGVLSAGVVSGEDLHYVRPFSGTTIDLFLDFTAPGSSMGDGQGCMATVLAEGDALTVACRAYIQDAQIGNTELEIMSHTAPGVYAITNRVAMALELTKGARQNIRLIYDQAKNFYVAFYRGEPVMTGKLPLPPVVSAVGVGFGATDTGSTFDTFSAGSSNA